MPAQLVTTAISTARNKRRHYSFFKSRERTLDAGSCPVRCAVRRRYPLSRLPCLFLLLYSHFTRIANNTTFFKQI